MQLIAEFNKKYPQSPARGQMVRYAAAEITNLKDDSQLIQKSETYLTIFTQPEDADMISPFMVYSYLQLKKSKEAFETGQKYLARNSEDVITRLRLTLDGANQLRAGNKEYAAQTREYGAKAIEIIEAGKKPADVNDTQWAEYKTRWLPQLYQSLGTVEAAAGDKAKAKTNLEKAVALDPKDVNSWLMIATMLDDEYKELATKFNSTGGGDLLKQANEKMDATIEVYARIVALTDTMPEAKQLNEQVRQSLENYYKYRHKNTDGLQALIDKYKK
jgi:tetratricopeptide (TPR) repeat protein